MTEPSLCVNILTSRGTAALIGRHRELLDCSVSNAAERNKWDDLFHLDGHIAKLDGEIQDIAKHDPLARRLQQLSPTGTI